MYHWRTDLSLGPELMITQHNVLLMEMLFWGSMLMIVIVTNLAWEPIPQDLYPWLHSNSISCPETLSGTCFPWLILYQSYLRMYVWKGPNRPLTTLRYSFYLFSAASWEVYKVPLKLMRRILFLLPQTFGLLLGRSSLSSKGIIVHPGTIQRQIIREKFQLWCHLRYCVNTKTGTKLPNYFFYLTFLITPVMASRQVDLAVQIKSNPYIHQ